MKSGNVMIDIDENEYTDEERRIGLPFFGVLIIMLIVLYAAAITSTPSLREAERLIPLTLLFILHAGLHMVGMGLERHRRWLPVYILVQGGLVFAIAFIVKGEGYILGLYLALTGEIVGLYFQELRRALVWAAAILLIATVNFGLLWGWQQTLTWLGFMIPMAVFVVVYVVMFSRQARARVEAQALVRELEQTQRQLETYASRVESLTLTNERQRMARELHDTLAQGLVGVILQLEAVEARLLNEETQQALSLVCQAKERARGTLGEARSAIRDLRDRDQTVEELGRRLREEVDRFSEATGIPCELQIPEELSLSGEMAEHVARMVAEGLANIARHAQASRAWVHFLQNEGQLCVEIGDDGRGFDPQSVMGQPGHYGLVGLRERVRLARGSLEIASSPEGGSVVRMCLPCDGGVPGE